MAMRRSVNLGAGATNRESTLIMGISRRVATLLCLLTGCVAVYAIPALGTADQVEGSPRAATAEIRQFPLWRSVPTKSFAVLGEGTVRQMQWGAHVFRGHVRQAGLKPCIVMASFYYGMSANDGGSFDPGTPKCGPLAPPDSRAVMASSGITVTKRLNGQPVTSNAMTLTFSPGVRSVKLQLHPGPSQTRRTKLLSSGQAEKAHVRQFRYLAFGIARSVCVVRVTGFDETGTEVFRGSPQLCH